ncbi:right-handed parallel beta-helix repeat-containing protein [candidate division KSB1 bacterium]|nr:right-handed parallel beta-helix repeat-containing protein [candidate division KSB1 bacterium]
MQKSTIKKLLTFITITILTITPLTTQASTYYVNCNTNMASDINPGTLILPWLTIGRAIETAVAGDTVYIRAGEYNEHLYFENEGNAVDGYIVFSAYPGERPIIDGTGVTETQNGIVLDKDYIKLLGLEIRDWGENGIWIENAANLELSDCTVHDVFYGIGVADGTHDFLFNRVEVHHFDLYGFDVSTAGGADCYHGTFNDCVAHTGRDRQQNVDGFALGHGAQHDFTFNRCSAYDVFDGFDISACKSVLNCCIAYDCWNSAYKLWQDEVKLVNCIGYGSEGANVELDWDDEPGVITLVNCTFYDADTYTIWVENPADALRMYNCILAGGDNIGLAFEQMGVNKYVGDNNIFHNDDSFRAIAVAYTDEFTLDQVSNGDWTSYSGQDAHSLVVSDDNILFLDAVHYDFHLLHDSPAIDHGTWIDAPSTDFEGNLRPVGGGVDIGAYEYRGFVDIKDDKGTGVFPNELRLFPSYPNPFNSSTVIQFELARAGEVRLVVYDMMGKEIMRLLDEELSAGRHSVILRGDELSSGVYLYGVRTGEMVCWGKMIVLR